MNIVVFGSADRAAECKEKFGQQHSWSVFENASQGGMHTGSADVIIDFVTPNAVDHIRNYPQKLSALVLFDTTAIKLGRIAEQGGIDKARVFGFCGLPTFVQREVLEISRLPESRVEFLTSVCEKLETTFEVVADHAGLVSPRVICMIINEAFYTLEEGIASREDIDLAMKLGTNYPYGPFEWAERIGLSNVVKVLKAAQEEGSDERYRVCPLLSRQA